MGYIDQLVSAFNQAKVKLLAGSAEVSTANPLPARQPDESILIDDYTTAGYTYVCYAIPGPAATSAAVWKIKRIDSIGCVMWADGNTKYDNVADNRAALTYSY